MSVAGSSQSVQWKLRHNDFSILLKPPETLKLELAVDSPGSDGASLIVVDIASVAPSVPGIYDSRSSKGSIIGQETLLLVLLLLGGDHHLLLAALLLRLLLALLVLYGLALCGHHWFAIGSVLNLTCHPKVETTINTVYFINWGPFRLRDLTINQTHDNLITFEKWVRIPQDKIPNPTHSPTLESPLLILS